MLASFVVSLGLATSAFCTVYNLQDTYVGSGFLSGFTWEAEADPTGGRVNYTDQATALAYNLSYANGDTFIMRVDDTTVLSADGPGRNSVRIKSVNTYTTGVYVLDLNWMPEGCATWPAWWTTDEATWPDGGEIDIIEYVNSVAPNHETLHTSADCTMPSTLAQTGDLVSTDCNSADNGNEGCGTLSSSTDSAGPAFNAIGGGWYAMERTTSEINIWFWARTSDSVPATISATGGSTVDTSTFGTPDSAYVDTDCDFATHFSAHNIIFDLTLCGSWAGADGVYPTTCPSTCVDYVNNYPSDFSTAYWDIGGLYVYE